MIAKQAVKLLCRCFNGVIKMFHLLISQNKVVKLTIKSVFKSVKLWLIKKNISRIINLTISNLTLFQNVTFIASYSFKPFLANDDPENLFLIKLLIGSSINLNNNIEMMFKTMKIAI